MTFHSLQLYTPIILLHHELSCISEAQKYQGALYKEKPDKSKKSKSVTIAEPPTSSKPRDPWVEDAPDVDDIRPTHISAPPHAPTPPHALPRQEPGKVSTSTAIATPDAPVNVFDFLDPTETPNASKISLAGSKGPMVMLKDAPPLFNTPKELAKDDEVNYDVPYEENGFSYGADTLEAGLYQNRAANQSVTFENKFVTPAPKRNKDRTSRRDRDRDRERDRDRTASPDPHHTNNNNNNNNNSLTSTGDKKRKRGHVEQINPEIANSVSHGGGGDDIPMIDAPPSSAIAANPSTPTLNHSGLTGGLNRMMRDFSPLTPDADYRSADDGGEHGRHRYLQDPVSPIKRTRRADRDSTNNNYHNNNGLENNALGIAIKERAERIMSLLGSAVFTNGTGAGAGDTVNTSNTNTNNDVTGGGAPRLVRTRRRSSSDDLEGGGGKNGTRRSLAEAAATASATPAATAAPATSARRQKKRHAERRAGAKRRVVVNGRGTGGDGYGYDDSAPRRLKAIEYHPDSGSDARSRSPYGTRMRGMGAGMSMALTKGSKNGANGSGSGSGSGSGNANTENRLVVYGDNETHRREYYEDAGDHELVQRERASVFLSLVTKGPDSEKGCSVHKALKRFHREGGLGGSFEGESHREREKEKEKEKEKERGRGRGRGREGRDSRDREKERGRERRGDGERELWRVLRLKRNDRGEVVLFV
ncbi:hypothetical protein EMCG_08510 [[Emmonsia] crescens]|uniref:Uncharacterized protein n=1 Tax=[Emmonsia] crescens TaxID=73230 RepID=A0A0G2J489_9EURO|nr:hypothetical protein EMCG_08510 [Emmonsia crescens UAMH 3008]